MPKTRTSPDGIEALLDRLGKAAEKITVVSEKQAREADRQLKRIIDRSEASTERLLKTVNTEIKAQIAGLRREIRDVERRVAEIRKTVAAQLPTKSTAKKAAERTTKKAPAKRAATKKAATKKAAPRKAAAKRTA